MKEVRLRAVEPSDVDFMLECENDEEGAKWSDYRAPLSRAMLESYAVSYDADPFKAGQLRLIIENAAGTPVGILDFYEISLMNLRAFVGITVHPRARRKGYGHAAILKALLYARRRLGLNQLDAKVALSNLPSLSLFEKAGFAKGGLLPRWHRIGNVFEDFQLLYHLL